MSGLRQRLVIVGSGVLGQQIAHHAATWGGLDVAGFLDDFAATGTETPLGPVLGTVADIVRIRAEGRADVFLIGVGYKHLAARTALFERCAAVLPAATLVHPSCVVDPSATVGHGTLAMAGCLVDQRVRIGANVLLNPGCSISHDSSVGEGSFFGPRVTLAGNVVVEGGVFLGVGTTVIDGLRIATGVRTGGGTVVTRELSGPGTYVGVPARKLV